MPSTEIRNIVKHLLREARDHGAAQGRLTPGGMWVRIRIDRGEIFLTLSQRGVDLSEGQMKSVWQSWPEALPRIWPVFTPHKEGSLYVRNARWKLEAAVK